MSLDEIFGAQDQSLPIVMELDRALVTVDVFHAQLAQLLMRRPWLVLWAVLVYVRSGPAALRYDVQERSELDVSHLRLNPALAAWLPLTSASRSIRISTRASQGVAEDVAELLPHPVTITASTRTTDLTREGMREQLVKQYGTGGYYYIGGSSRDELVGRSAAGFALVDYRGDRAPGSAQRVRSFTANLTKEIRAKHWLKNLLVFVPLVASHRIFDEGPDALRVALLFVAMCLVASSTYVLNDLVDYPHDAVNPLKSHRPLVSGAISLPVAVTTASVLLAGGLAVAGSLGWRGLISCLGYLALTLSYTYWFKRRTLVDVVVLSGLYVVRILAGAWVVGISLTSWLLLFALFFFYSLACVKRYTEVMSFQADGHDRIPGRGYRVTDAHAISMIGVGSGFCAILMYASYIATDAVQRLYADPAVLQLGLPVLLYWMSHLWLRGLRLQVNADPVDWAARDWRSIVAGLLFALVYLAATVPVAT